MKIKFFKGFSGVAKFGLELGLLALVFVSFMFIFSAIYAEKPTLMAKISIARLSL